MAYAVDDTVVGLAANGSRAVSWQAPERVTAVAGSGGAVWAAVAGVGVYRIDRAGVELRYRLGAGATALAADGAQVFALVGDVAEDLVSGATWKLPPRARLLEAAGSSIVYAAAGFVHVYDFASGLDRSYTGSSGALAGGELLLARGRRIVSAWRRSR